MRVALAEERRVHEASLAQARSQLEHELAQARRQFESELAQHRAAARVERERILREANVERDRIIAESRQMAARLAELQRSLGDLLRLTSTQPLAPTPEVGPVTLSGGTAPLFEPALPPVAAVPTAAVPPTKPAPTVQLSPPPPLADPVVAPAPEVEIALAEARPTTILSHDEAITTENYALDQGQVVPAAPTDAALSEPVEAEFTFEREVHFTGVQSFVAASDLLDQLAHVPGIESTRLVEYERQELTIAVSYSGSDPLGASLTLHLSDVARLVSERGDQVYLSYHHS